MPSGGFLAPKIYPLNAYYFKGIIDGNLDLSSGY